MSTLKTDAQVITESLDDSSAFAVLFDRHAAAVSRHVRRRLGPTDSDDVVAEVFTIAFAERSRFRDADSARPWLLGIATRLIARQHRAEVRRWRAYERARGSRYADDHADRVAARADAHQTVAGLARGLAQLSSGDRDVLLLWAFEELSYLEIASALDIPVGTVRSRLHRARRILRASLSDLQAVFGEV